MFLVDVSVAASAPVVASVFNYVSLQSSRDVADEQVLYFGKNIARMSTGLLVAQDVASLEDLLRVHAELPYVGRFWWSTILKDLFQASLGEMVV